MSDRPLQRLLPRPTLADRGIVALAALLCALVVIGAPWASAWLRTTADELSTEVFGEAAYPARQLAVLYAETADPEIPASAGATLYEALPPEVRALVRPPRHTVATTEAVMEALPKQPRYSPAYTSVVGIVDARSHVDVVEGRFPRPGNRMETLPRRLAVTYDGPRRVPVVEVALHQEAAEAMQVQVGSYLDLVPRRYSPDAPARLALLRVSGLYESATAYPSPLDDVDNLRKPAISTLPEFTLVRAAALAADVPTVLQAPWAADPEVRWTFDPDGTPTADEAEAVVDDAQRLAVQPWPPVLESPVSTSVTGIGDLAETFVAEQDASDTLAALVLASLAAGVLALLLAAASVLEMRRREVSDVLRARGASTSQLAVTRAAEALLVCTPGLLGALAIVGLGPGVPADLLPALVATAVCVTVLAAAQAAPWRRLPDRVRLPARDALQIVTVVVALGLAALMWGRDRLDPTDPLLLALPGLLGTASAVVAVRGVRLLTGVLQRVADRGRRLVPLVGLSQAGTAAHHVTLPAVAVVLAGCSALMAVSVNDTVHRGAERLAWDAVGADAAVTGGQFDEALVRRVEQLPGVTAVAAVHSVNAFLRTTSGRESVTAIAVDPARLQAVKREAPVSVPVPGPAEGAMGAVVSSDLDLLSSETSLFYARSTAPVTVTDRVEEIPGVTAGESFVLVDVADFRASMDARLLRAQTLLVSGDPDPDELRSVVRQAWPTATVQNRAEAADRILQQPVAERTLLVADISAVASALLALLAAGLAVALGGPLRDRTLSVLHALGAAPRQGRWVSAVELVPSLVGAGVAAVVCTVLLTSVIGHGVDLAALTGGAEGVALGMEGTSWVLAAAALAAVVVLTAAASARQARRGRAWPADHEGETR